MKVYRKSLQAMEALKNKRQCKDGAIWTIKKTDNGWYYLAKKEG